MNSILKLFSEKKALGLVAIYTIDPQAQNLRRFQYIIIILDCLSERFKAFS